MSLVNEALQIVSRQMRQSEAGEMAELSVGPEVKPVRRMSWGYALTLLAAAGLPLAGVALTAGLPELRWTQRASASPVGGPMLAVTSLERMGVNYEFVEGFLAGVPLRLRQVPGAEELGFAGGERAAGNDQGQGDGNDQGPSPKPEVEPVGELGTWSSERATAETKTEAPIPQLETRNSKPETFGGQPETRNSQLETSPLPTPHREYVGSMSVGELKLTLGGIASSRSAKLAILNGTTVEMGQRIDEVDVLDVQPTKVQLSYRGVIFYLRMP